MGAENSYAHWHIRFTDDQMSLRDAHLSMQSVGTAPHDVPRIVRLVENPRFRIPGVTVFHGAVDLRQHDFIHLVPGRGLLPKDEAFAIGFTMGTTNKVSTAEELLFAWISKTLYPPLYRFDDEDIKVFKDAIKPGYISSCEPLDRVDFEPLLDLPLRAVRERIGLERELIVAYYRIEPRRYPGHAECARLL